MSKKQAYSWIQSVLIRFQYHRLHKRNKGKIFAYIQKTAGYSRQRISQLIEQHRIKSCGIQTQKVSNDLHARKYNDNAIRN